MISKAELLKMMRSEARFERKRMKLRQFGYKDSRFKYFVERERFWKGSSERLKLWMMLRGIFDMK